MQSQPGELWSSCLEEAWGVRAMVVADGKEKAGTWTQTEESVGQRADFWLPEGATSRGG